MMQTPARGVVCRGFDEQIHTDYRSPVEENGRHRHSLSERGPQPTPGQAFLLFWAHYMRMVLIYYAQVRFQWLPFTENKEEDVSNYIKKEGYLQK